MNKKPDLKIVKGGKPSHRKMTDAELDAWLEADFQRVTRGQSKRFAADRFIGCPKAFYFEAIRVTQGDWAALNVALLIYNRRCICKSPTFKLPKHTELTDFKLNRWAVLRALRRLHASGLIRLHPTRPGCKPEITLLWPKSVSQVHR